MDQQTHRNNGRLRWRELLKIAATFVLIAYLPSASHVLAQTGKLSSEKQDKLKNAISKFMVDSKAPGVSAAVVLEGEFVWSAGFGMADLENSVPATSQTLYRLGSISKPITATAAMALWEQGKLDLDAPVQKYCPAYPQKQWPITTRELLGHLGGIRSYNVPEMPYSVSQSDPEVGNTLHFKNGIQAGLRFFSNDPLVAEPGSHFNYSTQCYSLVGCAIEGASGKSYPEYVREEVLVPAVMLQTRPDDRFAIIPLRTRFYSKDESGSVMNAEFLDSSYKVPGGGWLSSAQDMARFEVAILRDRVVKRATRDVMWTPQMPSDGLGRMIYGLGWSAGTVGGVKDVGHGGSQQGTSTMMLVVPDAGAGVVLLTNSDAVGTSGLASQLLEIALGIPSDRKEIKIDPTVYDGYVGTYQMNDFRLGFKREDDRLFALLNGQSIQIFPESTRDYVFKGFNAQLTFLVGANGRTTGLMLHEGGLDTYMNRVE